MVLHQAPAMHIDKPFPHMGIYETPYSARRARVRSSDVIVKLKEIMHETNLIGIIEEKIPTINPAVQDVV